MRFIDQVYRSVVVGSAILLGMFAVLGITPWRLVADEPKQGERQQSQHMAMITITQTPKGKEKAVLCAPSLFFPLGRSAYFRTGSEERCIEVSIESDSQTRPVEHTIQVKLIEKSESKSPNILAAPRIRLVDGTTATVKTSEANGNELEIDVKIEQVKPAK